jgi:CMP-N,N'-diacetyllegionaminic acid synthase
MSAIAIIPARSGSKGLPDKNIRLLNGIPLMAYTIQAAKESGCFSEIHVSTDSPQYAQIASDFGAQTPFLRSMDTSSDTASSWDVVKEVLQEYEKRGKTFDKVMLLQPTSPLRNSNDIKECFNMMDSVSANSIISVCEMDHSPLWSNTPKSFNGQLLEFRDYFHTPPSSANLLQNKWSNIFAEGKIL